MLVPSGSANKPQLFNSGGLKSLLEKIGQLYSAFELYHSRIALICRICRHEVAGRDFGLGNVLFFICSDFSRYSRRWLNAACG